MGQIGRDLFSYIKRQAMPSRISFWEPEASQNEMRKLLISFCSIFHISDAPK